MERSNNADILIASSFFSNAWLRFNTFALMLTVWISTILFALYIMAYYLGNANDISKWNQKLSGVYGVTNSLSTSGIALHFAAGTIILMLGCLQFLKNVRARYAWIHRWSGRIYVTASFFAGIGGLVYILFHGTVGGLIMNIGFSCYGILLIIAAYFTYHYARLRNIANHRRWAVRLFALAIGSWLYRMDYGFWYFVTNGLGHLKNFHGWFDKTMTFFFYVPNLFVAEMILKNKNNTSTHQLMAGCLLAFANTFVIIGTYSFLIRSWGQPISSMILN